MSKLTEKLAQIATEEAPGFLEKLKFRVENRAWLRKSMAIALKALTAMKAQGITQKELAERMKVSPQQVNKILQGHENLTLETITKLETALGITILEGLSGNNKPAA